MSERTSVSARLRAAAAPVWEECLHHPFVVGMGDGSLPVEKFRFFLLQDYLYLFEYARVFALGVVKARDVHLMREFAQSVDSILGGEMSIHRDYMRRMGIAEEEVLRVQPSLDNLSYTSYMLSVAHSGTPLQILAGILACSWSYAEIGQALSALPGACEHPFYGEWIKSYASEEYAKTNTALIERLDSLAGDASESEVARLEEIFVTCSRYELGFWDMAWNMRL